jgi:hypothetical protein
MELKLLAKEEMFRKLLKGVIEEVVLINKHQYHVNYKLNKCMKIEKRSWNTYIRLRREVWRRGRLW